MSEQDGTQSSSLQRPTSNKPEVWKAYWKKQDQSWRTEPEIDAERQKYLAEHRSITPNIEQGIYPFREIKLSRADVEWLLATHENGRGPVDWSDEKERNREGLDLRGADMRQEQEVFNGLPLAKLRGGLTFHEYENAPVGQREKAIVLMEGVLLAWAHLEGACLRGALLKRAFLAGTHLEGAYLAEAQLEEASLYEAQLEGANLLKAQLKGVDLRQAQLKGAIFRKAQLEEANLIDAQLEGATFESAQLKGATFTGTHLEGVCLRQAWLEGADLTRAHLEGANLAEAHLKGAVLRKAQLKGADLYWAQLEGVDLRETQLEEANLTDVKLGNEQHIGPRLADVQWGNVNLAVVDWLQMTKLGDEWEAKQEETIFGTKKGKYDRLKGYQAAVRANRQLAIALQNQGLDEAAARFAYRAKILQRKVLWKQRSFWRWFGSAMLALLAGYGYRMGRILVAYLFIVLLCAVAYFVLGMYYQPHLSFLEAVLTSVTAFHGRVFSEPFLQPGEPQIWVTAFEAVAGLVIEGVFIAMLTQKFFGK